MARFMELSDLYSEKILEIAANPPKADRLADPDTSARRVSRICGSVIDVDPDCAKIFPVMADIAAWRLMENWAIDLADAERKTRIRFTTPDDAYVADPETDGIFTIVQPEE